LKQCCLTPWSAASTLPRKARTNRLNDLSACRHDTQGRESATVDHGLTIYEHFVLPVMPVSHFDIDPQVTSEFCRHTGGLQT
jgi:hypothetical protein